MNRCGCACWARGLDLDEGNWVRLLRLAPANQPSERRLTHASSAPARRDALTNRSTSHLYGLARGTDQAPAVQRRRDRQGATSCC